MRIASILAAAALAAAPAALAASVVINPAVDPVDTGSVMQAKYRLSQGNFDQSLDRGLGTNPGQFIQNNLGNNAALSQTTFSFSVEHRAGEGFIFTMTNVASGAQHVLSWGTFAAPPAGTNAPDLGGVLPDGAFNALRLEARAQRENSSMEFRDLTFTSPTVTVDSGSFDAGSVTPATTGPGDVLGFNTQYVVADVDLSQHDWTLTGFLRGMRDSTASGDELVRFVIAAKQVEVIPTPTAAAMGLLGLAAMPARRRRR